ncbi:hypothetical protein, partial [Salmonella enterica]
MAKKNAPPAAAAEAGSKPPGKMKLIIVIVLVLLVAVGASIGGTWFFLSKDAPKEDAAHEQAEHAAPVKQPAI